MRRSSPWAAAVVLCSLIPAVARAQVRSGAEFKVNSYTTNPQWRSSVASDAAGNFVVVWDSDGQDGSSVGVFGQRFDGSGTPQGGEFRVNSYTPLNQLSPEVAADADGNFVVVWESYRHPADSVAGVFGQRYDASGAPRGGEFRVNSYTHAAQFLPDVASDAAGNFVVVWTSYCCQDGSVDGIFAQRYDASGVAQGGEFRVNSYTTGTQRLPAVAIDADGDFVVAWVGQGGTDNVGIFAQRYAASGVPLGSEFQVNSYTTNLQIIPAVASDPDGNFTVVWVSMGQDGSESGIFGQRYDAEGAREGGEFRVNSYTTLQQYLPSVAADPTGAVIVVWESNQGDRAPNAFAQRYDSAGLPLGGEFQLNAYTTGSQLAPTVASDANGNFVVVWYGAGQGDDIGVFGQRFEPLPDLIFKDGFESGGLTAWSASATDGGDLSVSNGAALRSTTQGLQGLVDDTAGLYVQDDSPADESRYRARFYFDTNGFDPGESQNHRRTRLFIVFEEAPTRRLAAIVLRRLSGAYGILGRARLDDNSQYDTGFVPVAAGVHFVELDWKRSSGPDANDGWFELWIDGTSVHAATTLDNNLSGVDFVRLGALSVKAGANGTLYWDEFESRRSTYIGP